MVSVMQEKKEGIFLYLTKLKNNVESYIINP